jgi:hypothetical protein
MSNSIWLRRLLPAAVGTASFATLSVLWLEGMHPTYNAMLLALGVEPFRFPFVDAHAILSAIECHRAGIDVYQTRAESDHSGS